MEVERSIKISRARLSIFLVALAVLIWTLARGRSPSWFALDTGLFVAFGALVAWHARVEERVAWHEALRVVAARGAARVRRSWDELPPAEAPSSIDIVHHAYAIGLDIFGRASLFQWLGPAATARGSFQLASWLLQPAPPDVVLGRQTAVLELS